MEQFAQSFLGTLAGAGVGGFIVYLAFQKSVENIVEKQLKPVWNKIDTFKTEYLSKEVFKAYNEGVTTSLSEIKSDLRSLGEKFDKYLLCQ